MLVRDLLKLGLAHCYVLSWSQIHQVSFKMCASLELITPVHSIVAILDGHVQRQAGIFCFKAVVIP